MLIPRSWRRIASCWGLSTSRRISYITFVGTLHFTCSVDFLAHYTLTIRARSYCSYFSSTVMRITYGIDVDEEYEDYVKIAEDMMERRVWRVLVLNP